MCAKEFHLSIKLFFEFLRSEQLREATGNQPLILQTVADWVRQYVLPHQDLYLYFKCMKYRTLDEITSSPHEGTNFGVKNHIRFPSIGH